MTRTPPHAATALSRAALEARARALIAEERARFADARPLSAETHGRAGVGFCDALPMLWMGDWPTPYPMVIATASGAHLTDIDGNGLVDLCLGDTGAMFGHGPEPILAALRRCAERGLTTMLPSADAEAVGRLLAERFGLPAWQVATTASDANRFAIRAARAITGRSKILVFDGCYHGAVDDTLVDLVDGRTIARKSLLGQVLDTGLTTVAIPFNDETALAEALAAGDIACVLAEPIMTNCGMISPAPGFLATLRRLTRQAGTLLLIDETHTLSSGLGGYTAIHGLEPDLFVVGKAVAGGVPVSVWGLSAETAARFDRVRRQRTDHGHSGMGTTLSGSAFQLACLRACLEEVMTAEAYAHMNRLADHIESGLSQAIAAAGLPWHVARVGARLEVVFTPAPVRDAAEARAAHSEAIEAWLHLAMLNRGYLLTPFHTMVLVSPALTPAEADGFVARFGEVTQRLARGDGAA